MPEQEEVEVKFVLGEPERLRGALRQIGAAFEGKHLENNIRLDDAAGSLTRRHVVLRLRRIEQGGQSRHVLTVKRPVEHSDSDLSRRWEVEVEVSDGAAALAALAILGYKPKWRYEKRRETYRVGEAVAEIDEMPYGWFIELEGPPEEVRRAAHKLGFAMEDGLTISYAQIFENVKRALELTMNDLTFEAFEGIAVDPGSYRGR